MKTPVQVKPALWGAAGGAVLTMFIGFGWGGWSLESSVQKRVALESGKAVIAAFAPGCAKVFNAQPDAAAKRVALKAASSWDRGKMLDAASLKLPGSDSPSSALAEACSALILSDKAV